MFKSIGKALGSVGKAVGGFLDPISSAASIASPFLSARSQGQANAANIAASREQMDFQRAENTRAMDFSERMSNTAYSRAVADMRAAGLSPMLAYSQGGSSTPSGVTSSGAMAVSNPKVTPQSTSSASQAGATHAAAQQARAQMQNIQADTANKAAQADQIKAQTDLLRSQAFSEQFRPGLLGNQQALTAAQEKMIKEMLGPNKERIWNEIEKIKADTDLSRASARQVDSQNVLMKAVMENPITKPFAPLLQLIFK